MKGGELIAEYLVQPNVPYVCGIYPQALGRNAPPDLGIVADAKTFCAQIGIVKP